MVSFLYKNSLQFGGKRLPALLVLFFAMSSFQVDASSRLFENIVCVDDASGNEDNGSMIAINGYTFSGKYLIINYHIQFPGMTKVKMFDYSSKQLLWRNQYVNDKEGDHRLILKREMLESGTYLFEFDYKNQKRLLNVSV
jgi:hypothetical protein